MKESGCAGDVLVHGACRRYNINFALRVLGQVLREWSRHSIYQPRPSIRNEAVWVAIGGVTRLTDDN
jgi:hypothetical protein